MLQNILHSTDSQILYFQWYFLKLLIRLFIHLVIYLI